MLLCADQRSFSWRNVHDLGWYPRRLFRLKASSFDNVYLDVQLNTLSNLGGTWPKAFVLHLVDYFTTTSCHLPDGDKDNGATCASDALRDACKAAGGTCHTLRDGYYVVNWAGLIVGFILFVAYVRPKVQALEVLGPKAWRVPDGKSKQ